MGIGRKRKNERAAPPRKPALGRTRSFAAMRRQMDEILSLFGRHLGGDVLGRSVPDARRVAQEPEQPEFPSVQTRELIEMFCRQAPDKAFEFGVEMLTKVAETMASMVEEGAIALAEIEARGQRIERLNEENKRLLATLIAG